MASGRVTLSAMGVGSYAELASLGADEVVKRLDEKRVPIHEGDAFLAVLMLGAVEELRKSAETIDAAGKKFQVASVALAAASVILAVASVILAVAAL